MKLLKNKFIDHNTVDEFIEKFNEISMEGVSICLKNKEEFYSKINCIIEIDYSKIDKEKLKEYKEPPYYETLRKLNAKQNMVIDYFEGTEFWWWNKIIMEIKVKESANNKSKKK